MPLFQHVWHFNPLVFPQVIPLHVSPSDVAFAALTTSDKGIAILETTKAATLHALEYRVLLSGRFHVSHACDKLVKVADLHDNVNF